MCFGAQDHPQPNRWPITRSRSIKMFVNIFDVPENGGPLSVVPGSHLLPFNPWCVPKNRCVDLFWFNQGTRRDLKIPGAQGDLREVFHIIADAGRGAAPY